jgi:hypothetical protein
MKVQVFSEQSLTQVRGYYLCREQTPMVFTTDNEAI